MDEAHTLAECVADALTRAERRGATDVFSEEVRDAMRLADLFSDVCPQEDCLPIDAMAGFPIQTATRLSGRD